MSWRRIRGVVLHNWYDMRRSPVRMMEIFYWPLLEIVLWGFITRFLLQADARVPGGVKILLGAVLLYQLMFRSSVEVSMAFLIDVWDRNILNIHASPLRPAEHFLGGLLFSVARVLIGGVVLAVLAWSAFGFNLLSAGRVLPFALLGLFGTGWAVALVIRAVILRYGSSAEIAAWSVPFLLQPLSAVFYPVHVLPRWLEAVALAIPATHVFEALRAFLAGGTVQTGNLAAALVLDVLYLGLGVWLVARAYRVVRERGLLGRPGY